MSLTKEFPRQVVCCNITAEISTGAFQTILDLVPGDFDPLFVGREPVEVTIRTAAVAVEVRTLAAEDGVDVAATSSLTLKGLGCCDHFIRSAAAATTIEAIISLA